MYKKKEIAMATARPRSDHTMHQGKRRPAPLLPTQQIEKAVLK